MSSEALTAEGDELVPDLHVVTLDNGAVVATTDHIDVEVDSELDELFPDLGWGRPPPLADEFLRQPFAAQSTMSCTRTDRNYSGRNESDDQVWTFRRSSIPAYLDADQTIADMRDGAQSWERLPRTDCATVPLNSIRQTYAGITNNAPNVNGSGVCANGNGLNTWSFFNATGNQTWVAKACTWWIAYPFVDDEITEVVFDTNDTWGNNVNDCQPGGVRKYMVSPTAAHETGHAFGFGHVDQASQQTMVPQMATCSKDLFTLGRGDMTVAHEEYVPN